MTLNILAPAAVLAVWSMIVLLWMFASRVRGFAETGIDLTKAAPGARYADIENRMPPRANWKSHNYTHLMEQPTLFYALVAIIALSGGGATAAAPRRRPGGPGATPGCASSTACGSAW